MPIYAVYCWPGQTVVSVQGHSGGNMRYFSRRNEWQFVELWSSITGQDDNLNLLFPTSDSWKNHPNLSLQSKNLLVPRNAKTKSYGGRAFQIIALEVWNSLPQYLRDESSLDSFKTHLFHRFC